MKGDLGESVTVSSAFAAKPGDGGSITTKGLVVVVVHFVLPCATWGAVDALDVAEAPLDLGSRVRLPVRAGGRHLVTRKGLRNPVRAGDRVFRVHVPGAL